jgi:hypothetical protein
MPSLTFAESVRIARECGGEDGVPEGNGSSGAFTEFPSERVGGGQGTCVTAKGKANARDTEGNGNAEQVDEKQCEGQGTTKKGFLNRPYVICLVPPSFLGRLDCFFQKNSRI